MIPEHDPAPRPPLTLEYAFMLALVAPLCQFVATLVFEALGFHLKISSLGMGTLVAYAALFALCAARLRAPPSRQFGFVAAPATAWVAVLFLAGSIVLSSEVDNLLRSGLSLPAAEGVPPDLPPYFTPAFAVVAIGALPLAYDVFFRGMFQPLASARLGGIAAVVLTTALSGFASGFIPALALNGWQLPRHLLDALVLCILRECAGSLWPVLALHVLWGVATFCATYGVFGLAGFDASGAHTPTPWVAGAAALTVVGLALCRAAARASAERSSSPAQG
jgi:membrane protease YdiL (CAAX protease family)